MASTELSVLSIVRIALPGLSRVNREWAGFCKVNIELSGAAMSKALGLATWICCVCDWLICSDVAMTTMFVVCDAGIKTSKKNNIYR